MCREDKEKHHICFFLSQKTVSSDLLAYARNRYIRWKKYYCTNKTIKEEKICAYLDSAADPHMTLSVLL